MISFLFHFSVSEISNNVFPIFNENWFVECEFLRKNETLKKSYFLNLTDSDKKAKELNFDVKASNTSKRSLYKVHIIFQTKGTFNIKVVDSKEKSLFDEKTVELMYSTFPHASATGLFGGYAYNLDIIDRETAQLTLFNQENGDMIVFNLKNDHQKVSLLKGLLPIIYFVALFVMTQFISKRTIKKYEEKQQEKQGKNTELQNNKSNKKVK